jgi:predicted porin
MGGRMSFLVRAAFAGAIALLFPGYANAQQQQQAQSQGPASPWQALTSDQPAQPLSVVLPTGMKLTAFGVFDISEAYYSSVSNRTNTGTNGPVTQGVSGMLTVPEIGLKGEQPIDFLGTNAKFIFDIEAGFDDTRFTGNDPNHFFSRNAFLGATGDFGTLTFGRQWNFNDGYIIGSFFTGGYPVSIFRLTEFGELSDLHDNVLKYVTPSFHGFQAGAYYQFEGDTGAASQDKAREVMVSYKVAPFSIAAVVEQQVDPSGNVVSQLETLGASYVIGDVKLRGGFSVNHLSPSLALYPGGAAPILILTPETASLYSVGADWKITPKLTLSGDYIYRDNLTLANNSQIYRLLADYRVNAYVDVYGQLAYLTNGGGAAESFFSYGAATYLGSGYANQSQFVANSGLRFRF